MTLAAFASAHRAAVRQVRRWCAEGMPVTTDKPPKVRAAAAAAWLRLRSADRGRARDETRQAIEDHIEDVRALLAARVAEHSPAPVIARRWDAHCGRAAAALREWPAVAAPRLAARLRGEDASPIEDPLLRDPASLALLARSPASTIAVALASQAQARACLEQLASEPPPRDPEAERLDAAARARWLAPPALRHPRPQLATWRARAERFARAVRGREWERTSAAAARWESAVVAARQHLLDRAPAEVVHLPAGADEAAIRAALGRAVEDALRELRLGARRPGEFA